MCRSRQIFTYALVIPLAVFLLVAMTETSAQAWTFNTLHSFCLRQNCADGTEPLSVLVDGPDRILGTTFEGGSGTYGTAFALHHAQDGTWKHRIVFDFCACADGGSPIPGLVEDIHGNLYGITTFGFAQIYKVSKQGALQVLHTFCGQDCGDGSSPSSLTYAGASSGARYDGTSPLYGVSNNVPGTGGIVFQLQKQARAETWDFSIVHTFCSTQSCTGPSGPLSILADTGGSFFGTTENGGLTDNGVVFELRLENGRLKEIVLANFCTDSPACTDGQVPTGYLTMDAARNLYGTTQSGGTAGYAGLVYEVVPRGKRSKFIPLHSFCSWKNCADGWNPRSGVVVDADGNVFGTAASGGAQQQAGVLFEISGRKFQKLYDFCALANCADGSNPEWLTLDGQGDLFGVTDAGGGRQNGGTVFELSP